MGKKKDPFSQLTERLTEAITKSTETVVNTVQKEAKKQTSGGTGTTQQKKEEKPATKPSKAVTPTAVQMPTLTQRQGAFGSSLKAIDEKRKQTSQMTPTALVHQERQQVREYNDSRTKAPAEKPSKPQVQMPTLTQRMSLLGTYSGRSALDDLKRSIMSTDSTDQERQDAKGIQDARTKSAMKPRGDEDLRGIVSGLRWTNDSLSARAEILKSLGRAIGDTPSEKQIDIYLRQAALYQSDVKSHNEYLRLYKAYVSPESYQKRIDGMEAQAKDLLDQINAQEAKNSLTSREKSRANAWAHRAAGLGGNTYKIKAEAAGRTLSEGKTKVVNLQKELEELEAQIGQEKRGKALAEYELLRQNPDFEKKSAYKTTANGKKPKMIYSSGKYDETGYDDILYDVLNGDKTACERALNTNVRQYKDVPESVVKLFNYIYATQGKDAAYQYMDLMAEKVYTGAEAIGLGAYKGTGLWSLTEALGGAVGDKEYKALLQDFDTEMATARRQHPTAYGVGEIGGTLALATGLGAAGKVAAGAAGVGQTGSTIISGAAGFGGTTAVQEAGDVVTGKIDPGQYFGDVLTSSISGAAGSGASTALGKAGASVLQRLGLTDNRLARGIVGAIRGGGSATARVGVTEGSKYLRNPGEYEFNGQEATTQILISVAFDFITGAVQKPSAAPTAQNGLTAEEDALLRQTFGKDYHKMSANEITKAYRTLARANHPDIVGSAGEDAMKSINAAYDIYQHHFIGKTQSQWQMAEAAKASGDTAAYKRAAADFADSVNGLQSIVAASGTATAEVSDAMQILSAVAASMTPPTAEWTATPTTAGIMPTAGGTADLVGAEKLPMASGSTVPAMPKDLPTVGGTSDSLPTASGLDQAQKTASTGEAELPRMTMADFTDTTSPVWRNVAYEDKMTQRQITQATHQQMVNEGRVVTVPESTAQKVAPFYPDVRALPRAEKNSVLKEKTDALKRTLRQFLGGLRDTSFEFEVNGNILEAKLYGRGISEVMKKLTQDKASMLYHSGEIFKGAQYLYSTPDYDGDPNIYRWNYFYTPVQIGSETVGVRIAVRDVANPQESQIYHWDIKKGASVDVEGRGQSRIPPGVSLDAPKNSIPQTAQDVNLKGRSLGDRVADATKRTLEEMARTEKKARFLKESKPLRDRLAQIQAEGEAGLAQTRAQYEKAVADRETGTIQVKDGETAEQGKDRGKNIGQEEPDSGIIKKIKSLTKEGWAYGEQREETRKEFERRCHAQGYKFVETREGGYGFRRVRYAVEGGDSGKVAPAVQIRTELETLGVNADVIEGPVLQNKGGVTRTIEVPEAATVERAFILINKDTGLPPRNVAGHEAFHLWGGSAARDAYVEVVEENLLLGSEEFFNYQAIIAEAYLGGEVDLSNQVQVNKLFEELFAYISGDIHEGGHEDVLRRILRDYDAVRAAWEALIQEQQKLW